MLRTHLELNAFECIGALFFHEVRFRPDFLAQF